MKSKVFKLAHQIKSSFSTFSQALKAAWKIIKMQMGYLETVMFAKSTGEVRKAEVIAIGSLTTIEKGFVRFIEIIEGKSQWRSFRIERMIFN